MTSNQTLNLTYPKETDFYDIDVFNDNFKKINDGIVNLGTFGNAEIKQISNILVQTESWVDDSTFMDYPYKATILVDGITQNDWWCTILTPDHTDLTIIEALAPYVFTGDGSFNIYSKMKFDKIIKIEHAVFECEVKK